MNYRVTFVPKTGGYRLHSATCANAVDKSGGTVKNQQFLCAPVFENPAEARRWADEDESEKCGYSVRAIWRVCACAKL